MTKPFKGFQTVLKVALAAVLGSTCLQSGVGAPITEPGTVFYGKVFDLSSGQVYQIHEGNLVWVIRRADGINQVFRTQLRSLNKGEFSYHIQIPHEVLASGLQPSSHAIPLRAVTETHAHLAVALNGQVVSILGPAGATFDAAQAQRAQTHRLDLAIGVAALDADGNGLPDWWELQNELTDPNGDPDGDGLKNLAEFLGGSNPNRDDRVPSLASTELRVYADGSSVARLRAIDSDSETSNLVYTVIGPAGSGSLYLRNGVSGGSANDVTLGPGFEFTQADVDKGNVIFIHAGGELSASSLELSLRDEDASHMAYTGRVAVLEYRPGAALNGLSASPGTGGKPALPPLAPGVAVDEQRYVSAYLLARDLNYIVCDGAAEIGRPLRTPTSDLSLAQYSAYVVAHGSERPHVLLGGLGQDVLRGSMADDLLAGGRDNDSLRGNGGADVFLVATPDDGNDTIEDFSRAENDVIDVSRVLVGTSQNLADYLQLAKIGSNTVLRINFNGTGTGYSNMVVTLAGAQLGPMDLYSLVEEGSLFVGDKELPPLIGISVTSATASENGPKSGEFTLTRRGSTSGSLTVNLLLTGSAMNGIDYAYVSPQISFAPGQQTALVTIAPYPDATTELLEYVKVTVLAGTGYNVDSSSVAEMTIADLLPELSIGSLEPRAVRSDSTPGLFLINRGGILDRSVLVRLQIGGTAVNGTDYVRINSYLNLQSGQTAGLIEITPLQSALLQGGKSVDITLKTDPAYLVGAANTARVMLIEEMMSFALWRSRFFPQSTGSIEEFASQDPGAFGLNNLQRYAFGMNPTAPERNRLPKPVLREGYVTADLWRRPDASDLDYTVQVSTDPVNWGTSSVLLEELFPSPVSSDPNVTTFRALPAVSEGAQLFFKFRVDYRP